jgi:hypothetical protein
LISKITDRLAGELGGKIFVVDVPTVVDIRTKKRGDDALRSSIMVAEPVYAPGDTCVRCEPLLLAYKRK